MRELSWVDSLRAEALLYLGGRAVALRDSLVMRFRPETGEGRLRCEARDAQTPLVVPATIRRDAGSSLEAQLGQPNVAPRALLVICHGIGERLFFWRRAQQWLAEEGIVSLVFHYTGYGASSGRGRIAQFEADAILACQHLRERFPGLPLSLLGTSMGTAVAIHAAGRANPQGLILSQGFPSLREAACEVLRLRGMPMPAAALLPAALLPDVWRNAELLQELRCPVLVVHGTADELFPVAMGELLFRAAEKRSGCSAALLTPQGFAHSDISLRPASEYWDGIRTFVLAGA